MVKHLNPQSDEGKVPTPAQQIIVDLMGAVINCVMVKRHDGTLLALKDAAAAWQFGFDDAQLVATLRAHGYVVDAASHAFTVSVPQ